MVYRRSHSHGNSSHGDSHNNSTGVMGNHEKAGKHERQGSKEEMQVSEQTPSKLKRPLSLDNDEPQHKKMKVTDAALV